MLFLVLGTASSWALAQSQRELYPSLSGLALQRQIEDDFSPRGPLNYGIARDTLFRRVWATAQDSLVCQYTGYTIYLQPGADPTEYAIDRDINTEHLYPQSKGAESGDGRADMHHLYPTHVDVNTDRGSLPFGEIPDQQTLRWYRRGRVQNNLPPASIRDEFSERTGQRFEPRELRKGDIARAMFYFWTIYRAAAQAADSTFFGIQAATLCDWHDLDPVDADEAERSRRIARYQGNENPFILDCTLARRLGYCTSRTDACTRAVPVTGLAPKPTLTAYPNPVQDYVVISGIALGSAVSAFDALGHRVAHWPASELVATDAETAQLTWVLPAGAGAQLYFIRAGGQVLTVVRG